MKIYIADMRKLPLSRKYERLLEQLPEEAVQRAKEYKKEEDRVRSAAGALMIRQSIDHVLRQRMLPVRYHIARGKFGKPYVAEYPEIHFSLSHSGAMIVCAQADEVIGVDVEGVRDIAISDFERYLTANETGRMASSRNALSEFFHIWTVREAFSKMTGQGLSLFEEREIAIDYEGESVFYEGHTYLTRTIEYEGHVISFCMEHIPDDVDLHLITKEEIERI